MVRALELCLCVVCVRMCSRDCFLSIGLYGCIVVNVLFSSLLLEFVCGGCAQMSSHCAARRFCWEQRDYYLVLKLLRHRTNHNIEHVVCFFCGGRGAKTSCFWPICRQHARKGLALPQARNAGNLSRGNLAGVTRVRYYDIIALFGWGCLLGISSTTQTCRIAIKRPDNRTSECEDNSHSSMHWFHKRQTHTCSSTTPWTLVAVQAGQQRVRTVSQYALEGDLEWRAEVGQCLQTLLGQ